MPDSLKLGLIIGGIILGILILVLFGFAATSGMRARKKTARLLTTGTRAEATVVLLQERPNTLGFYDLTLEVAAGTPLVVKVMARIPLERVPSVQQGRRVTVRYDPAKPSEVVFEDTAIACYFP